MRRLLTITILLLSLSVAAQDTLHLPQVVNYFRDMNFLDRSDASERFTQDAQDNTDSVPAQLNRLLDDTERRYGTRSTLYAENVLWCAYECIRLNDLVQGRKLLNHSRRLFRQYGCGAFDGRDTLAEILWQDAATRLEYSAQRDFFALQHATRSCQLKKEHFGERSEVYLNALLDLSDIYAERMLYKQANYYHNLGFNAYVERIKTQFCQVSESERMEYWERAKNYISKTISVAHKMSRRSTQGDDLSIASAAYNALLLSKGLMLNTSNSFESFISESGNSQAIRLLQLKKNLSARQAPQERLDSIDYAILALLSEGGTPFRLPGLDIRWQDISASLGDGDLAVEFYRTGRDEYGAVVLRKDWKTPRVIRLGKTVNAGGRKMALPAAIKACDLEHYAPDQARQLWNVSRAVWTDDIADIFPRKGQGSIFFAADGDLQIIGIEHMPYLMPDDGGAIVSVSDLFDVHRLSSTRELTRTHAHADAGTIAVYGGLRYDSDPDAQVTGAHKTNRAFRKVASIDYLEGTLTEADSIVRLLNATTTDGLNIRTYTGEQGTEASFKTLADLHPGLIHIATHGFFFNPDDDMLMLLGLGTNPMARSGLLLAGVEQKWFGMDEPDPANDGILTALEIANMDLRGLELVALSACETGKGDVLGDGVFGLQRGFKIAGANSILMSLWKVDDDATCLLMTEFYRNWFTRHMSKHDALRAAKQTVRSHTERGWDNPSYWAAFILLDALK